MSVEITAALVGATVGALVSVFLGNYLSKRAERQRIRFQILIILVGQRGRITSENVKDHLNAIPLVFAEDNEIRRAFQHFCATMDLGSPDFFRRYNELVLSIARNLGFKGVVMSDLELGFFPTQKIQRHLLHLNLTHKFVMPPRGYRSSRRIG